MEKFNKNDNLNNKKNRYEGSLEEMNLIYNKSGDELQALINDRLDIDENAIDDIDDINSNLAHDKMSNLYKNIVVNNNYSINELSSIHVFRIEDENYLLDAEAFQELLTNISNLKPGFIENKQKIYLLPRNVNKESFELFINVCGSKKKQKIDLSHCQQLLIISHYFNYKPLISRIINEIISPSVEKSSALRIIKDHIKRIYDPEMKSIYMPLVQKAINISADNIFYLINNKYNDLVNLGTDAVEEIVENFFEKNIFNNNLDYSQVMRLLLKNRNLNDIFDLLENERKKSISFFEKLFSGNNSINNTTQISKNSNLIEPNIIWNICSKDHKNGFYKESEEFQFEKITLVLINYYDSVKDTCSIAIKIKDVLFDKDVVSNNTNQSNSNLSQYIISILSICEIDSINLKTKVSFNCVYTNLKSKVLICRIDNFSSKFKNFDELDYNLSIYFNISYNFSLILTHICKNFYEYYSLANIEKIPKNVLTIILKYDNLNVRSEDEVLEAATLWLNCKSNSSYSTSRYLGNQQNQGKSNEIISTTNPNLLEGINDVMKLIKWNRISLDGLLDFILNESKLILSNQEINNLVINEFQRRFKEEYGMVIDQGDFSKTQKLGNTPNSQNPMSQRIISNNFSQNKKSNDFNNNYNLASSNNNTEVFKKGFTADFINKLISKIINN